MTLNPPPDGPVPLEYAQPARNDPRCIAVRQKAVMYCILADLVMIVVMAGTIMAPLPLTTLVLVGFWGARLTGAVFNFMLALSVFSLVGGIILGILTLIPYLGIFPLLIVNQRATRILKAHGIRVGLMGANSRQIPSAETSVR